MLFFRKRDKIPLHIRKRLEAEQAKRTEDSYPNRGICADCALYEIRETARERGESQSLGFCHRFPHKEEKQGRDWCAEYRHYQAGIPRGEAGAV